jgi:hypothetical protein
MDSTSIYQEGYRIGPVHLYKEGIPQDAILDFLTRNSRLPRSVWGDMNAQIAAQSCDLLLDQQSGFFSHVQLDDKGIQAVLDLRSKLGDNGQKLTDPSKYIDKRYWQKAMQP